MNVNQKITLRDLVKENYTMLTEKEKKVAKFVVDHYQKAKVMSSSELAKASGVSYTSVIRFTKALGFKGFMEYKNYLKNEATTQQRVYTYINIMESSFNEALIPSYLHNCTNDIMEFINTINSELLDSICKEILKAENVYLVGLGSDIVVPSFLRNYLSIMGINCFAVCEEGLSLKERLFNLKSSDLVMISSFPSLLEDEKWIASYCNKKNTPLIAFVDSEITGETLSAKYYVCVGEKSDIFFNSYIISLLYCNVILLRLYELSPQSIRHSLDEYQQIL